MYGGQTLYLVLPVALACTNVGCRVEPPTPATTIVPGTYELRASTAAAEITLLYNVPKTRTVMSVKLHLSVSGASPTPMSGACGSHRGQTPLSYSLTSSNDTIDRLQFD